jgi:hypothetical protein
VAEARCALPSHGLPVAPLTARLLAALPDAAALAAEHDADPGSDGVRAALAAAFERVHADLTTIRAVAITDLELALAERLPVERLTEGNGGILFLLPGTRRGGKLRLFAGAGLPGCAPVPGVPAPAWMDGAEHVWEVRGDAA